MSDITHQIRHCAEYHYLDQLNQILGDSIAWRGTATLTAEDHPHDPAAVRITINGIHAGYLARDTTWRFHALRVPELEVPATITRLKHDRVKFRFGTALAPVSPSQEDLISELLDRIESRGGTVPAEYRTAAAGLDYLAAGRWIEQLQEHARALVPANRRRKAA